MRPYVLGTHDAEAARLGLQHRLWSDAAHEAWRRVGLRPGHRVLDVGCGPGFATFDLAQIAGAATAVDESARFVEATNAGARARGLDVHAVQADVQGLPTLGEFDLAWARWVLCFVPDPAAVVRGVARQLAPGGRFVVHDYFAYESMSLAPRGPAFSRMIEAVGRSFRSRGGDPDVVSRLPRLFRQAGLEVERVELIARSARPGDSMWSWPDTFFRGYVPMLTEAGHLAPADADAWLAEWNERCGDPDTFMLLPPVWEIIGRR